MIYDHKKIKKILVKYIKENPSLGWHIKSKLNSYRYQKQLELCVKLISKNGKVLDIGCGLGQTTVALKIMRPDLNISGLDHKRLDMFRRKKIWKQFEKMGCRFIIGDATRLKFKDKSFDAVISFGVLEHVKDDDMMLKEIYRILKPNGLNFIFNLPNKYSIIEFLAKMIGKGDHFVFYTGPKIKKKLKKQGFRNIKIKREFIILGLINRINERLGKFFNKHYLFIDNVDRLLTKTPLNIFAQSYLVICKK